MKKIGYVAVLGALAVARCSSTPGEEPLAFTATAGGLSATGTVTADGIVVAADEERATATIVADGEDGVAITFAGGGVDGRTIDFEIYAEDDGIVQGEATAASLQDDEQYGDLTAIFSEEKASFAGFVTVERGDFDAPQENDEVSIYAFYGANPVFAGEHSRPAENARLSYQGRFVGVGTDQMHAEGLRGQIAINADFGTGNVSGTISGLAFDDSQTDFGGGDVGFAAAMSTDRASYAGSTVTMNGGSAIGAVEGGFYGAGAAETAGAIFADDETGNVLIGGFQADRQ